MADGQAVMINPRVAGGHERSLEKERHDLEQYERILHFRDAVLSGKHPTIKLPAGLSPAAQSQQGAHGVSQPEVNQTAAYQNERSFAANAGRDGTTSNSIGTKGVKQSFAASSSDINPILLEKSEDLVKAEFKLKRQRLERALKEEADIRRGKQDKGEPLADADLTDVLSKALTLVQATTSSPENADTSLAANNDNASDSFDDNTFYSSRHDTPESHLTSRVRNESQETPIVNAPEMAPAPSQPHIVSQSHQLDRNQEYQPSDPVLATAQRPQAQYTGGGSLAGTSGRFHVPGLDNYIGGTATRPDNYLGGGAPSGQTSQTNTSTEQSQSEESANVELAASRANQAKHAYEQLNDAYIQDHPPSPLVRTYDIAPAAPQPTQTASYVVEQPLSSADRLQRAAPGPVAALRTGPIAVDSPDSSPQSGKGSDKKKGKKKKRKADRQAPEEVTPYIKPEPRSPSPMSAPFIRPNKRRRQGQNQGNEVDQDEVAIVSNPQPSYETQPYQGNPAPADYGVANGQPQRAASTAVITDSRYGREYIDERRYLDDPYVRRQPSPARTMQRAPSTAYAPRPAPQLVHDDGYREPARQYREPYDPYRMSVRPEGDPYLGQLRPQPTRIIVDSFGREYIEPPRSSMRQSVAPMPSHGAEVMYERPPPRAVSRHPGPGAYDNRGGVVYARPPSAHPGSRRVVTQPEYASQDIRDAHPREYSVYPADPGAPYVPVMTHQERRPGPEGSREYGTRAASTRPVEHVRYGMPREHGQLQSARPETTTRDYDSNMNMEGRREVAQPYVMEYGARPIEQPVYHRGYSVRPADGYYDQQPVQQAIQQPARTGDDIAFIERPRGATQEIVYADDARREIYR